MYTTTQNLIVGVNVIKHFCDFCDVEIEERIKIHIEAQKISGEGFLKPLTSKHPAV